ncbi:tetratricopeptide repeat protein [Chitinimonas arctica]|uniref:Tetratricopeptide repeat protein n=1 Tax=Chitinimonas arctica TaxID=2594795 RepID=A0A516SEG5_9NEIS|nr:tetratricopeptide repeat protein [Chitinimonas arctica]QDQ26510.1 tetratricopeptide repeat protein [Chitinimonas arctica]
MSLLLDALKKAEEAKRRKAEAGAGGSVPAFKTAAATGPEPALDASVAHPPAEPPQSAFAAHHGVPGESSLSLVSDETALPVLDDSDNATPSAPGPAPASDEPPTLSHMEADGSGAAVAAEVVDETVTPPAPVAATTHHAPPPAAPPPPRPVEVPLSTPQQEAPRTASPPAPPAQERAPAATSIPPLAERPPAKLSADATRQLIDGKGKRPRPAPTAKQRMQLIGGVLLVGLLAAGGWLWWQMQPPTTLLAGNAPAAAEEVAPPTDAPAGQVAIADAPAPKVIASPPAATAKPPVSPKRGDRASVVEVPKEMAATDVHFRRDEVQTGVPRNVQQGYQAFQQGDYARAAELYRQQLQQDDKNRDALLGMAATAVKRQQLDEARMWYGRVLANNPKDELAGSALVSLAGDGDADQAEGRLKRLLENRPNAETATALASLMARQGRWREAQGYYFQAHAAAPGEADYAYNLAVALDALGEQRLAADFYGKALLLATGKTAGFDSGVVRKRLAALGAN